MDRAISLSLRLKELFIDGKWIANTNYTQILADVTWEEAIHKIDSFNTIADLTFHINYYLEGIIQVFQGGTLDIRDQFSFDTPILKNEKDWNTLRSRLHTNANKFIQEVSQLSENQLEKPFTDEKYGSYSRNIEAVLEHSYYHLGQISLLKKRVRG